MTELSMELSGLSSTQSNAQLTAILVNAQGIPLKINLQAVELEGRPKLVRLLKSSGALVVSNAREAVIILVDSTTESGKRLIRTWGHDGSKVVLEHTWARASIDAGRPLLEADNWGGAMTVDDGKPVTIDGVVVDEDELEEVEALVTKSPLPTPRVTPVDHTSQRPGKALAVWSDIVQSESSASVPRAVELLPLGPPIVQPSVTGVTLLGGPMADTHNAVPQPQSPPPPPATQPVPYVRSTLYPPPSQSQDTYAYAPFSTQQVYSSQPQVMSTQPFSHSGFPPSQPQMVHAPSVPHTPFPSIPSQMMQTTSNMASINGVNLQNPNLATIMTIMEVVRHMDQSSRLGQNQLPISQPPVNSIPPIFSVQATPTPSTPIPQSIKRHESPNGGASLFNSQDYSVSDGVASSRKRRSGTDGSEDPSAARKTKSSRRPPDEILAPSISRKRPPAVKPTNPPPKRLRKGKEKATPTDSSEHLQSEADELVEASDASHYSTHSSAPSVRPRKIIVHKEHGEIFLSEAGQPLRFFVQVDLHGRHTVVTNIKKNKGKIVNNIADADYLILFTRSDTFRGLLDEAIALGKFPILAAFVADCVEEGALLDETDYVLESVTKVKSLKRGRQGAFSFKVETTETISHQTKATKPKSSASEDKKLKGTPSKSSTNEKSKKAIYPSPSKAAVARGNSVASRSPTPPPATSRQMMKSGKYLFTEGEDEYFLRLAKHHLTRDPTISNTALIYKLHKKLPHHSVASWAAHIDKKVKGALEEVRKRANIANRKRLNETVDQNSSRGFVNEGMPLNGHMSSPAESGHISSTPSYPSQGDLERQDFVVITRFFASGGGDDDNDERVWQELEKHQPCRSASSWPDYYAAHEKQVYAHIEELMNARAGDN